MAKLQFATLSNLTEFLSLHNVQIDAKISEAVKSSIKTVSQSADGFTLYFYTKTAPVTIEDAVFTITLPKDSAKADKVTGAVNGHLAGLDANGNLVDSGKSAADFDEAGAATKAKSEVMTYVGTIPADAKAKDVVAYIKEAVTAGAYDDSDLKGKVATNTAAIETLNGTGDGSVKKAVADAVAQIVKLDSVIAAKENKNFKAFVGACTTNSTPVYQKATGATALATYPILNRGNLVDVVGVSGSRYKIKIANAYTGYIDKNKITTPDKLTTKYPHGVCTGNDVAVRKGAGKSYHKISGYPTLNKDNEVDILGSKKDSSGNVWKKVRIAGKHIGYVFGKYIKQD